MVTFRRRHHQLQVKTIAIETAYTVSHSVSFSLTLQSEIVEKVMVEGNDVNTLPDWNGFVFGCCKKAKIHKRATQGNNQFKLYSGIDVPQRNILLLVMIFPEKTTLA